MFLMDIKKLLVLSGIALSTALILNIESAQADNASTDASGPDSQAAFQVSAGDGDSSNPTGLKFVSAPTFTFAAANVKDIATKDTKLALKDAENPLQIEDYRGSNAATGWAINAQLSQFKNEHDSSLDGTITFCADKDGNTTTADDINASIGTASQQVWQSNSNAQGTSTATATTNNKTQLSIPQSTKVSAGQYVATINWTLSNTASN